MVRRMTCAAGAVSGLLAAICFAAQSFIPDATFKGSTLAGFHVLGQADWRAENGELIGTPKQGGGWLVLDKSYQDVEFSASFRCSAGCKTGILLRAEKTPVGMKGIYVSLAEGDLASYRMTLDPEGRELSREKLAPASGMVRFAWQAARDSSGAGGYIPGFGDLDAPLPSRGASSAAGRGSAPSAGGAARGRGPGGGAPGLRADDWNTIQVVVDADILRPLLNERGGLAGGATGDRMMGYGPIALYIGGSSEVRFKDVAWKDLNPKFEPKEQVSNRFRMQRISDYYYAWGAAAADINHDGILDVIAGPFYYLGPDYTERKEFTAAQTFNPSTHLPQGRATYTYDFNGDGWSDIVMSGPQPTYLYINPKGESRRWDRHLVADQISTEFELMTDIDGDKVPELLYGGGNTIAYAKADPANPTAPWVIHRVSETMNVNPHSLGVGDINGDGRMEILATAGWWEQPPKGSGQEPWKFHPVNFGAGAEMGVYDVNGDGLNDVVTSTGAHGFGLSWFEQRRDAGGNISFVQHNIMGDYSAKNAGNVTFSEAHGAAYADIDGDGIPDFIVGKRHWSHLESYTDPDPYGPAVLYWYRTVRNPRAEGGAEFVPDLIHNRSGAGSQITAVDLNHDGAVDIITSTNRGLFIFWGKPQKRRANASSHRGKK
jgi:hypothetical protein